MAKPIPWKTVAEQAPPEGRTVVVRQFYDGKEHNGDACYCQGEWCCAQFVFIKFSGDKIPTHWCSLAEWNEANKPD